MPVCVPLPPGDEQPNSRSRRTCRQQTPTTLTPPYLPNRLMKLVRRSPISWSVTRWTATRSMWRRFSPTER